MSVNRIVKQILVWKESQEGVLPTVATNAYAVTAESYDLGGTQNSEESKELGQGRGASEKDFGAINYDGNIGFILSEDNAPILCHFGIGETTSSANAGSGAWTATTVVTKGEIFEHSDGLHSLTCVVAGTTDATEPDLSAYTTANDGRDVRIVDATVTWIIMPLLIEASGERADCLKSFGVEIEDDLRCAATSSSYVRTRGVYAGSMSITITGDTTSIKTSIPCMGKDEDDSIEIVKDGGVYTPIKSDGNFTVVEVLKKKWRLENGSFYINDVLATDTITEWNFNLGNNVSMDNALNGIKGTNTGVITLGGSFSLKINEDLYYDAITHANKSFKIVFEKDNGTLFEITLPNNILEKAKKDYSVDKDIMVTIPYSSNDTESVKSISWRTISPISLG